MERKPNHPEIDPLDVLQYVLGRVSDPEHRAAIERTRQTHPELWDCLEEDLEDVPEAGMPEVHLGPDATEDSIPEAVADYFAQREEVHRLIDVLGRVVQTSPDGRQLTTDQPLLSDWKSERYGGRTVQLAGDFAAHYEDGARPRLPELPEPPYVVPFGNRIYIAQSEKTVPYGVVRILASVNGRPLASVVRMMEFDDQSRQWNLVVAVTELFGRDVPDEPIDFHVQPACRALFAWFPSAEIEGLASRIRENSVKELQCLRALLHDLKEWEHGV